MEVSEIKYSQLDKRFLNAEYYKTEYLEVERLLNSISDLKSLKEIAKEITSGSYIAEYVNHGTLYLRVNNVRENEIDLSDVKYVDIERSQIPDKIRVKADDVLLTRTGTIGLACVVPKEIKGAVISQHLTRITLKENINPFYVAVFLNTKLGRKQTERGVAGSLQKELIHDIQKSIKIPIPPKSFQNRIAQIAQKAINLRNESERLIENVMSELESYIGASTQSTNTEALTK